MPENYGMSLSDDHVAEQAVKFLENPQRSPFFMLVNQTYPHPPYAVAEPFFSMYDRSSVPFPIFPPEDFRGKPKILKLTHKRMRMDEVTDDDLREIVAVYYGMISYVDAQMQRVHEALERRDMLRNTWIILGSDHGDYTGEKGLFNKSESLYECLLHVPLIIVPSPGTPHRGPSEIDALVNTVDLFPTILRLAGLDVPEYAQGHDLVEWVGKGASGPLRDAVFSQVGDYHGYLKTTFPGGIPESGRRACLAAYLPCPGSIMRSAETGNRARSHVR